MNNKINTETYKFFHETLLQAGQELKKREGRPFEVKVKADTSLVTEADLASERVIVSQISKYFPGDTILAEESGLSHNDRIPGTYIWIIDPLDGTTNFANGYPFYCISVGRGRFREDGSIEMLVGGIWDAPRSRLFYAELGNGAYVDGRKLKVAPARDFAKAFLVTGFYYNQGDQLQGQIERFGRIASQCQTIRRDGAAALDLAYVAEGIYDAFWELGLQAWDLAAGTLMVSEAGGVVRNYPQDAGTRYGIEGIGVIAGSGAAVETISSLL
jgi:myo-inositol-1(or 4)-monophosphatase